MEPKKVMFASGSVFIAGWLVGHFKSVQGDLRAVVQSGEMIFSCPLMRHIHDWDPSSPMLRGCTVRECRILPPINWYSTEQQVKSK